MTVREVTQRLLREDWTSRPGKGHTIYRKPGYKIVVVPNHRGDIPIGTLKHICRFAGWEFPPQS